MRIDRRTFLILGASFTAGCVSAPGAATLASPARERVVNAGPAAQYLADGVYTRFRNRGFFIVRRGARLFALSAICTHRNCKLEAEPDKSFYCPCHDSTFDPDGQVTTGPARKNLPLFALTTDAQGNLLVTLPGT
jgi:nitrite reductase/ring-hydroxylating ferredoxin subunit